MKKLINRNKFILLAFLCFQIYGSICANRYRCHHDGKKRFLCWANVLLQ